jgi:hypothetical protein
MNTKESPRTRPKFKTSKQEIIRANPKLKLKERDIYIPDEYLDEEEVEHIKR